MIPQRKPLQDVSENMVVRRSFEIKVDDSIPTVKFHQKQHEPLHRSLSANKSEKIDKKAQQTEVHQLFATISLQNIQIQRLQQENTFLRLKLHTIQQKQESIESKSVKPIKVTDKYVSPNQKLMSEIDEFRITSTPQKRTRVEISEISDGNEDSYLLPSIKPSKEPIPSLSQQNKKIDSDLYSLHDNVQNKSLSEQKNYQVKENNDSNSDSKSNSTKAKLSIRNFPNILNPSNDAVKSNKVAMDEYQTKSDEIIDTKMKLLFLESNYPSAFPSTSQYEEHSENIPPTIIVETLSERIKLMKSSSLKLLFRNNIPMNHMSPIQIKQKEYELGKSPTEDYLEFSQPLGDQGSQRIKVPINELPYVKNKIQYWNEAYKPQFTSMGNNCNNKDKNGNKNENKNQDKDRDSNKNGSRIEDDMMGFSRG